MNYAQAGQLGVNNANALYQGAGQQAAAPVPRTIASAIGRVDGLNERLSKLAEHLANISDQIGGPRPTGDNAAKGSLPSAGAVGRMNDSVECAHDRLSEIEGLASSISRALG